MKKMVVLFLVAALVFTGFGTKEASAASTYQGFWLYSGLVDANIHHTIVTSESGNTVYASIEQGEIQYKQWTYCDGCRYYWTMDLQQYVNGSWLTIKRESGYVERYSPSHRTFTGVPAGYLTRIKTDMGSQKTIINSWQR